MTTPYAPDPRRRWKRREYDLGKLKPLGTRQFAELETDRDLDKPIEQLVCDVHEETHTQGRNMEMNAAFAQKRMVSLMGRVALSNDKIAKQMLWLTVAIAVMTAVMVWYTITLMIRHSP